jgi:hypothetical protein
MKFFTLENQKTKFLDRIYVPCVVKYKGIDSLSNAIQLLERGKAVLDDDMKCDWYIAFYGGHHFHKLYAAFGQTNFDFTKGKKIEIVDWGCGQAIATCVLIDYLIKKQIQPNIVSITLIDPSAIALRRGYQFVNQMFDPDFPKNLTIRTVNKYIDDLTIRDLVTDSDTLKVHLFSNILDIEEFSLIQLHKLIIGSLKGHNRFICTSPGNERRYRLDDFHNLFLDSHKLRLVRKNDEPLYEKIFHFKTKIYEICKISRCERQFTVNLS